ncbi:hypothetical protein BU24DRAFT_419922 [Aaosphaeria arxii CBS 175.79]|uniref:Uncharacterized protein n=1 Tax=Aaosphaeria arxii CBS 175.79 TaxID=1450172 RepID=A0A6A5XUJ2_9PLEO|nr:uncharacterized protein BU24DRAFT_419922 [Aaosphaeria arxii CBS 175.79]KAF2016872.1 hypothetical protein BU24DRAFT_419922 [Aaosphaeria arxii CBS 175.79]
MKQGTTQETVQGLLRNTTRHPPHTSPLPSPALPHPHSTITHPLNRLINLIPIMSTTPSQPSDPSSPPCPVVKKFAPRSGYTLHRLTSATPFVCSRCNNAKKAKLVALAAHEGRWDQLCCNACYGELLSKGGS